MSELDPDLPNVDADEPTEDELAEWLRMTEARLDGANRALAAMDRTWSELGRKDRRGKAGRDLNLRRNTVRSLRDGAATLVARLRGEMDLEAPPDGCLYHYDAERRCELPFGHLGFHQVTDGKLALRWE